jgi:hypothetical protein
MVHRGQVEPQFLHMFANTTPVALKDLREQEEGFSVPRVLDPGIEHSINKLVHPFRGR